MHSFTIPEGTNGVLSSYDLVKIYLYVCISLFAEAGPQEISISWSVLR